MRAVWAILSGVLATASWASGAESLEEDQALLRRFKEAAVAATHLPQARELLLRLKSERVRERVSILEKKTPATPEQQHVARDTIEQLTAALEAAPHWKPSPAYRIARRVDAIEIDGSCEEPAWKRAEPVPLRYAVDARESADAPYAQARLLWDDEYLYAAFEVPDESIVAPPTPRDADVFLNDCIELFIMPLKQFGNYWELNISPGGAVMDQFCAKYQDAPLSYFRRDLDIEGMLHAAQIHRDADGKTTGYSVEAAIPLNQLPGLVPQEGTVSWILMARANRDTPEGPLRFYSHAPMLGTFHNIWTLPQAVFVKPHE